MAGLHHLIYQSTAVLPLSGAELGRLLVQSRTHNDEAGITGMLLYDGNRFLQVLEGPPNSVDAIFGRISLDCRHTEVEVLANGPVAQRQFGNWSMGLVNHIESPVIGIDDVQPTLLTVQDAGLCMLLHDFQRHAGNARLQTSF
ncbi:BLUF domain-containing protein [Hymenobacter sp. UYP22]|uniref:BLUF domain-containing protein n=1 Tax=Hymenobacter sp. UYP22 TaxID=3156348 RepID=UPI003392353E